MFAMRLAALAGRIDVDGMLSEISAEQLSEWAAFMELEPHGPARGDLQAGIVASQIVNMLLKKGEKPTTPADFLLTFGEPRKKITPQEREARIRRALEVFTERGRMRREIQGQR